jgi:hypothetical protein
LWSSVLGEFELSGHELSVLRQAVRAADRCEALAAALAETGLTQLTAHGAVKLNPLAAELRSAELVCAVCCCACGSRSAVSRMRARASTGGCTGCTRSTAARREAPLPGSRRPEDGCGAGGAGPV